jgi:hypothetical protein
MVHSMPFARQRRALRGKGSTMAPTSAKRRKFPTSLNGGESQDPDDVRVGETHVKAPEGFERGVARDTDATETGPDSEFDTGQHLDDRLERRDEAAADRTPSVSSSSASDALTRSRDTDRAR